MRLRVEVRAFAAFTALTLVPVASHAEWSDLGLRGHVVTQLRSNDGLLYACTTDGLHRKASDTADSAWVLLGFAGQWVRDVLAVSPETLIVAREISGSGADTVALFRSTDGGANWAPFQNGLGAGEAALYHRVTRILELPGTPGTVLAATWNGVWRSTDGGLTWNKTTVGGKYFFLVAGFSSVWGGGRATCLRLSPDDQRMVESTGQ